MVICQGPGLRGRALALDQAYRHAVAQCLGAAHHQQVAGLQPGEDLHVAVGGAHARGQDALDGLAVFHHKGQEALLAGADGRLRHDRQGAGAAHRHPHLGERAGAQGLLVLVDDLGGDGHHARTLLGGSGDMDEARLELPVAVAHLEVGLYAGLQAGGIAFVRLETQQQGIAAHQRGHDRSRLDVLPRLHGTGLDHPGDRRPHIGVVQIELGLVQGRPGLGHFGGGHQHLGPPGLDFLARNQAGILLVHRLAPFQTGLGIAFGGSGLGKRSLSRFHGQGVALRLDLDQHLAAADAAAFGELHLLDHAGHARGHLDLFKGLDRTHGVQGIGHVAVLHPHRLHGKLHLHFAGMPGLFYQPPPGHRPCRKRRKPERSKSQPARMRFIFFIFIF